MAEPAKLPRNIPAHEANEGDAIPENGFEALKRFAPVVAAKIQNLDETFVEEFRAAGTTEQRIDLIFKYHSDTGFREVANSLLELDPILYRGYYKNWLTSLVHRDYSCLLGLLQPLSGVPIFLISEPTTEPEHEANRVYEADRRERNAVEDVRLKFLQTSASLLAEADTKWRNRLPRPSVFARHLEALRDLTSRFHANSDFEAIWSYPNDLWLIPGKFPTTFKSDAAHAIQVLDLHGKLSGREPWMGWLDLLRQETEVYEVDTMYPPDASGNAVEVGIIPRVMRASADYLQELTDLAVADSIAVQTQNEGKEQSLSEWLSTRLKERAWDKHDIQRHDGPNHKTVQKILKGGLVRPDVLERLASALSKKGPLVSPADIPQI